MTTRNRRSPDTSRSSAGEPHLTDSDPGDSPALRPLGQHAGAAVVAFWGVAVWLAGVWSVVEPMGLFFLAGATGCLIVSLPMVVGRRLDLLSPWNLVLLAVYLGLGARGLFISAGIDGSRSINELYLLGRPLGYFVVPSFLFILGLTMLTIGYTVGWLRPPPNSPVPASIAAGFEPARVTVAVLACAAIGFVAFVLYIRETGDFDLGRLSGKRAVITGLNLETSYQSHGEFRVLNRLSTVAFWLQLASYAYRGLPHGPFTGRGVWLAVLFVNASLLPAYTNVRADIVLAIVSALAIELCLRRSQVRRRVVILALASAVLGAALLTSLRAVDQRSSEAVRVDAATVIDTFVLTRNFSDIPTSAHIINAVPGRLEYRNGSTIVAWLAAPIPRSLWSGKPLISTGPVVGRLLYGNERSGVPPGLIAESYWNFGISGLVLLPLLAGVGLRRLQQRFARLAHTRPSDALLLSAVVLRFGLDLMTNSIGYALFQLVLGAVVLIPVIAFVRQRAMTPAS